MASGGAPVFLSTVNIRIPHVDGFTSLTGHVENEDGSLPRTLEPYFNINAFATVSATDLNKGLIGTVYVNNFGDYLIPGIPVKQSLTMTAAIEKGAVSQDIRPEAQLDTAPVHLLNLRIRNTPPRLDPITAADASGHRIQSPAPGATITLTANARDADGDPASFLWLVAPEDGSAPTVTGKQLTWTLPAAPGRYFVSVVAYDGKGGYAKADYAVLTGQKGVIFSGVVVDPSGQALGKAEITIVGSGPVLSGADGTFATSVPEADRYVVNVRKEGYALNSQIFNASVTGGRWTLRPGRVLTIDPTVDNMLRNPERAPAECPGLASVRAGLGVAGKSLQTAQWQDGQGNIIDPPTAANLKESGGVLLPPTLSRGKDGTNCGPGFGVALPANSIVDAEGNPAKNPLNVTLSTVDLLSPDQMPGDGSTNALDGSVKALASLGAGALDLPAGFKMRQGASAQISIPVDRSRLSGDIPKIVPLLSYDEKQGVWKEEGQLQLTTVAGVPTYVAKVVHFTNYNADTLFTNNACVRVFSPTLPASYDLEEIAPLPDGTPHVKKYTIDNQTSTEHVIYNLVPNRNLTLAPMTVGATPQLLGYYVVNAGPQTPFVGTPGAGNAPPGPPYLDCKNFVELKVGTAPTAPFGGEFLNGLGFIDAANLGFDDLTSAAPSGNALVDALVAASKDYYATVNPVSPGIDRSTLAAFRTLWGFGSDPNEITASYANSGDLGFGRDMHCLKKSNGNIACYVTNYGTGYSNIVPGAGTPDVDDANAAGLHSTVNGSAEVATVAMEYAPIAGDPTVAANINGRTVKFYVYKKGLNNSLSISANLDGRGERPVPQLCMVCHGGTVPSQAGNIPAFSTAAQVNLNSRFLVFDHRFFTFPTNNPNLTKANQEVAFQKLNQLIVKFAPPAAATDPIEELIGALYNGANPTQLLNVTVPGWVTGASGAYTGQTSFYQQVVANGCRTCHVAQSFPQLQFNTSSKFVDLINGAANNHLMLGTAQERVCGDYTMPHALRTHEIFWGSFWDTPNWGAPFSLPVALQNFGNGIGGSTWKTGLCTAFLSPNVTTPSVFYQHVLQPLWDGKCVACHIAGGQASFMPLTDGVSFGSLHANGRVQPPNDTVGPLILRTTAVAPATRMPPNCFRAPEADNGNLPCLEQGDIDKIKAWIRSGAN